MTEESKEIKVFGEYEEEAIVSLMVDHPEFFISMTSFLSYELFSRLETQYVVAHILKYHEDHGVFPTRGLLVDNIKQTLTVDSAGYEDIIAIAGRESNPREIPAIKSKLLIWAKSKAYGLLYDPDTILKYTNGDYESLEEVFNKARNVQDISTKSLWFFDEIERMFNQEEIEHFTTGFPQLDAYLHDGGPSRKEMLVWIAPTGVGKSIVLANNAIANVLHNRNVLYITLELSDLMSGVRMLGTITNLPIDQRRFDHREQMTSIISKYRNSGEIGDLVIHEFPPDEISVDQIYALIDHLRRSEGWNPDIICIDYLELMISRRESDNQDDYRRQKAVATQVRGLASETNTLVFSATQTNRSGNDSSTLIDVTKAAESYGKIMPIDYLISLNQSKDQYNSGDNIAPIVIHIAKNRTGKKFQTIMARINYSTMKMQEGI